MHPKYGAHLSREEVDKLVAPHPDTLELVHFWLTHHGVHSSISTPHSDSWLTVTVVSVSLTNSSVRRTGSTSMRNGRYCNPPHGSLPLHARGACEGGIEGARDCFRVLMRDLDPVTLDSLRWLYKTFAYVPAATGTNTLWIVGYNNQYPSPTDLTLFMTMFRQDAVDATFTVEKRAIAYPIPHIYYGTGGGF
ncbi:hypothetical protein BJY52DRAFT_1190730 [Lactarius psammicola]|nr:hypothetical protein BJY52DRAFT_1190730 [Lactarius psammicola]